MARNDVVILDRNHHHRKPNFLPASKSSKIFHKAHPGSMAKTHKSVTARGIAKYAAEAHRRSSAAYRLSLIPLRNEDELREKARIRMAAHRRRLKEHDEDWQKQKERARASDQKYRLKYAVPPVVQVHWIDVIYISVADMLRTLLKNSAYAVKGSILQNTENRLIWNAAYKRRLPAKRKATVIAQEVAADEEREKHQEALMNWTQEWVARSRASQSRSIALDAVGRSHHMS
ncbi:hypothetical protein B0H14DRAFT_2588461 [Mycena olivaceomarginata]|nr:hypothetical protein B0H14DRAFT_2588461 [Mycena olivaceomarginata]